MDAVSGTLYSYFYLCHRKVWLYFHRISFEQESDIVRMGKLIDENSYDRARKHIHIDDSCVIDAFQNQVVCEVKKSDKREGMAVAQVRYYLYVLKKKGIWTTGKISYPTIHKTTQVVLDQDGERKIEHDLAEIESICKGTVPKAERKSACTSCAYFDFCFAE